MIKSKSLKFKVTILIVSMVFFSIVFSGCLADILLFPYKNIINSNKSLPSPTITPNDLPPYDRISIGTAKKLIGKCIFINIFLSDEESSFSDEEKQEVMDKIKDMDTFFNEQSKKYNKDLIFIYNLDDLSIDYNTDFIIPINENDRQWSNDIISDICSLYDINSILKKYSADNLAFIINVNKAGRSYANVNSYKHNNLYNNESIVIFSSYWDSKKETTSQCYAHETLHLFGAIDLYYPYNPDDERLPLANEYFPDEIMIRRFDDINKATISNLTAYLIGWDEHLEEKYEIFLEEYKIK